jgi:hypothetical protein
MPKEPRQVLPLCCCWPFAVGSLASVNEPATATVDVLVLATWANGKNSFSPDCCWIAKGAKENTATMLLLAFCWGNLASVEKPPKAPVAQLALAPWTTEKNSIKTICCCIAQGTKASTIHPLWCYWPFVEWTLLWFTSQQFLCLPWFLGQHTYLLLHCPRSLGKSSHWFCCLPFCWWSQRK